MSNQTANLLLKQLLKSPPQARKDFFMLKRKFAKEHKSSVIANNKLLRLYLKLLSQNKIKPNKKIEDLLKIRKIRTLSGVAPIAVLTREHQCPGKCIYCPNEKGMPKSYLSNEPAVMRAILCDFNPFKQIKLRLRALELNGHDTDKIELIIMGGTWSCFDPKYQYWFIIECFRALNGEKKEHPLVKKSTIQNLQSKIKQAQKKNESAKHRCVGMTLETRPDYINEAEIIRMRELGCTKVEIGVQNIDDKILAKAQRGHNVERTIQATKLLKDAGFKITYHMMPNLPGATPATDLKMFKKLFADQNFQPDLLKIYPTVVTEGSDLYKMYKQGRFKPYSDKILKNLLIKILKIIPKYVRITRLIRDIPKESIVAGNKILNLRQIIEQEQRQKGVKLKDIRYREIRDLPYKLKAISYKLTKYKASGGTEYFLSYEDAKQDKLLAFLRLRITSDEKNPIIDELKDCAIIRELHTYGQLTPIKKKGKVQHIGWGTKLMREAEKIAKKHKLPKMAVISGIGVRKYYEKLVYKLDKTYMVKKLK